MLDRADVRFRTELRGSRIVVVAQYDGVDWLREEVVVDLNDCEDKAFNNLVQTYESWVASRCSDGTLE